MWWETLNLAQKIFFCVAAPATLFLIAQIILMIIGFGSGADVDTDVDVDVDLSADGDVLDADVGFSLFTVRGLTAFLTVGGWVGYTLADGKLAIAVTAALLSGMAALVAMAFLLKWLTTLQSNGNLNYNQAVGSIGEVYLTIPAKDAGKGKVNVMLNERYTELSASQEGEEPIPTGAKVKIVSVLGDFVIVERI